jgi:hypothetical protein
MIIFKFFSLIFKLSIAYVKNERSKEEYKNIEESYAINDKSNMKRIHQIFFQNLKQIFNSYNHFLEKVEGENKVQINELNKAIEETKNLV